MKHKSTVGLNLNGEHRKAPEKVLNVQQFWISKGVSLCLTYAHITLELLYFNSYLHALT